ncbi:hypothetical protein [Lactococcus lactis]|uniref:hypothetical protein n=1 Tax=Lactococcus lactis TaxID=1358 RepID=UPI00072645FA|nr:hypothetical protein [Lactococcus lactis]KST89929.1 hypothetical protein LKF24_2124 [Lactococcus lactis subsp. lactis]
MKITIEQDIHTEFVDGKIIADQSTTVEFDFNDSVKEEDTSINALVKAINEEFKGGRV